MRRSLWIGGIALALAALIAGLAAAWLSFVSWRNRTADPVHLIVTDPLARELACACVPGFGQRDYRRLARHLEQRLDRRVAIEFSDDLADSLARVPRPREVLIVGERSTSVHAVRQTGWSVRPAAELTGPDGSTTVTAVYVARRTDRATTLGDLAGRTILVGLAEPDAAHTAARAALEGARLNPPARIVNRGPDSKVGLDVLDSSEEPPPVAAIPEYTLRLLEGCGSIAPGSLKVIGRTAPCPFITVFLSDTVSPTLAQLVLQTLSSLGNDPSFLEALETRDGFRALPDTSRTKTSDSAGTDWPDWRGLRRDGRVPQLPPKLPTTVRRVWKRAAMPDGLAGLSVAAGRVLVAERDLADERDVYRCLDASHGETLWRIEFDAPGRLDYGQSPRATPVIHSDSAFLLGAFGELRRVNLSDGRVLWRRDLIRELKGSLPTWGACATPLIVDDLVIVNPGCPRASVVALDAATGRTRWTAPGAPAAYASFILIEMPGHRQIVGYDARSIAGWDPRTGKRLWELTPPQSGDFNVPTPIWANGALILATENNGTRLHRFDAAGRPEGSPGATFAGLSPETATPVATAGRLFGLHRGLHCLDLARRLQPVWYWNDDALGDHATLIADDAQVLVITATGELILLDALADTCTVLSRLRIFEDDVEIYVHPALAGGRLFLRGGSEVVCVELSGG